MKNNPVQNRDTLFKPITLSFSQKQALENAIPFRHSPEEMEPIRPVGETRESPRSRPAIQPRAKSKWHAEHDAMRSESKFDTDIVMNEPRYQKAVGEGQL